MRVRGLGRSPEEVEHTDNHLETLTLEGFIAHLARPRRSPDRLTQALDAPRHVAWIRTIAGHVRGLKIGPIAPFLRPAPHEIRLGRSPLESSEVDHTHSTQRRLHEPVARMPITVGRNGHDGARLVFAKNRLDLTHVLGRDPVRRFEPSARLRRLH